jgi:hypothetical protein
VLDELASGEFGPVAKGWVQPFQSAFPDFEMDVVELLADGPKVVGHFRCSGTHLGEWGGVPATGRRFELVDEIYIFEIEGGRLVSALGVEDNLSRMRQLGIYPRPDPRRLGGFTRSARMTTQSFAATRPRCARNRRDLLASAASGRTVAVRDPTGCPGPWIGARAP